MTENNCNHYIIPSSPSPNMYQQQNSTPPLSVKSEESELSSGCDTSETGDTRRFGDDITNYSRKRNRTVAFRFFDGTVRNDVLFDISAKKAKKRSRTGEDEDYGEAASPKKRGRPAANPVGNNAQRQRARTVKVAKNANQNRTRTFQPVENGTVQLIRQDMFNENEPSASRQRARTVRIAENVNPNSTRTYQPTDNGAVQLQLVRQDILNENEPSASRQRARTVRIAENVNPNRTSTYQPIDNGAVQLIRQDMFNENEPSSSRQRARTTFREDNGETDDRRSRTDLPVKKRATVTPRERGRTRGRPSKGSDIQYNCEIEGDERVFPVSRELLSKKSGGFKTLFEANSEDLIEIEGIPDKTLESAISFCHGRSYKEGNFPDTFSLLFFADIWEMPELKEAIEGCLLERLTAHNVVIIANAAVFSNSEVIKTACKSLMLEQRNNGEIVRNYSKLNDRLRAEVNELLKNNNNNEA